MVGKTNKFKNSMKFSRADGRIKMRRFPYISGPSSFIFRLCWWFGSTKTNDVS